jgi:hypothetical protein
MHPLRNLVPFLVIALLATGCGDSSRIKAKGIVKKGGQPYLLPEGEGFRIFFVPLEASDGVHFESYAAMYDPHTGSFEVQGKDGKGLPPGKYRVDLQLMQSKEDLLGGKLLGKGSPLSLEVTGKSSDLVIDLDAAKFDELLAANKAKAAKKGKG